MPTLISLLYSGVLCVILSVNCEHLDSVRTKYEPNWESLDTRPLPQWYDNAKVGIFLHWGVYSVPSFGSEWFWRNWKIEKNEKYEKFMKKNYKPKFSYQEFANDFTGELFNATQWALLFRDSGARYVVLTSKHHDGFALWPSSQSFSWNSVDLGPKLDIIKHLSSAIRKNTSLKFGLYYSLFEWFNRMYLNDYSTGFLKNDYVIKKMQPELRELVLQYLPEVIWSDGDWDAPAKYWQSEDFLAWLYNDSPVADTVVTNSRWGEDTNCHHGDFRTCSDRYNPGVLEDHKWENALTLDKTSWGHRFDTTLDDYMSPEKLIREIASTVSCGGNILVNVGPTKYGTISPIFEERLRDMGHWLQINGEAIYNSRPWVFQNDTITPGIWYTSKTTNVDSVNVFAMVVDYPYDTNEIDLYALRGQIKKNDVRISLLGMEATTINWKLNQKSLRIQFPPKHLIDKNQLRFAWTFKITITRQT